MNPPLPRFAIGTRINDRYDIRGKLGSDGDVYRAHDEHLDTMVAVKLLPVEGTLHPTRWDEARLLEELKSRCLIEVLNADVDSESDIRFIVTPIIEGGDLESVAKGVGLEIHRAVRLMRHAAAGVDRIHAERMLHRDIKPANILVDGDEVRVSDLGFCSLLDATGSTEANGTWQTVAPEVISLDRCTIRSDLYSLGATAFFAMAGQYPVPIRLPLEEQIERIRTGQLDDLRDVAPHVPQSLASVVRKALRKNPSERFESADDFGNALVQAVEGRRGWERVLHVDHIYCAKSHPFKLASPVNICAEPYGGVVRLKTTYQSTGRRVRGCSDVEVSKDMVPKAVRDVVKSLS
ncbi:serine/threonine-protein kinase [Rhodococcus sp. NBC_00297]|uniref:serine/threonine-protein kinase n=1 Tax=Rhodococcus sp. NBC_00297 TaxID=2976005 RepID=UPI002E2CEB0F|nr:serine/threonine-protein kinase [Rhodococcus sp. NBC_00297]